MSKRKPPFPARLRRIQQRRAYGYRRRCEPASFVDLNKALQQLYYLQPEATAKTGKEA